MKKLLASLDLTPADNLGDWMALAQAVQDQRRAEQKIRTRSITRGTALYAIAELDPDVYAVLDNAGLDWPKYRESIGIEKAPPVSGAPPGDVNLHKNFEETIRQSRTRYEEVRELDVRWLALFIVGFIAEHPELGALPKRLHGLGLDVGRAADELLGLAGGDPDKKVENELAVDALEDHVGTALLWAQRNDPSVGNTGSISATGALQGVLKTETSSKAFRRLREILELLGTKLAAPSISEAPKQSSFTISPALAETLSIAQAAIPGRDKVWGRALVSAILYAPERVFPEFTEGKERLGVQWRSDVQDQWTQFLLQDDQSSGLYWSRALGKLRKRYLTFCNTDPAYAANQIDPVEPGGRQPTDSPVATATVTPRAWVETDAVPVIGQDNLSRHSERDSLDANEQAELFATLLIAKDVQPPFAIGLLGDWGVGKTFFMRLMQEKVGSIAGKNANAEASADSVSRAAQIEFNAWHFVDSDLWASLASHLFDGLSHELRGKTDTVADVRRRLRRTIRSSEREQEEAKAVISEAQASRKRAAKKLAVREATQARIYKQCDAHRLKRIWDAVLKVAPDPNDPDTSDWPNLADARSRAEDIAKRLGIADTIDTAEQAQDVYQQLRSLTTRGSGLAASLATAFAGQNAWRYRALVLALLALTVAWPWLLSLSDYIPEDLVAGILAPILRIGTVVGPVLVWLSNNLKLVSSGLDYLEKIRDELQNPRVKPADPSPAEAKIRGRIETLDLSIATEKHRLAEADRQISEAQAEIQRINTGGLVYDFLEGRVRDSRYLDRLGLISVIRQDFEQLAELLRDWRAHGGTEDDNENAESSVADWDTRPIERIILYIDDLDRCPPERVVEVLQAVHLILAFELFVVVVAVDPRWLERSLNEAYNARSPSVGQPSAQERQYRFSAQNYLEKIFQIPFSLPIMDVEGYRNLVSKMTNTPRTRFERTQSRIAAANTPSEQPRPPTPGDRTRGQTVPPMPKRREPDEPPVREPAIEAQKDVERKQHEQKVALERIAAMLLHDCEEQFIGALYPFISTPRLAKRFINIYRLLRVSAAKDEEDFVRFIEPENGEYRVVLTLLAISVGRAETGPQILNDMSTLGGGTESLLEWLMVASKGYKKAWSELNGERSAQNKKSGLVVPPSEREEQLEKLTLAADDIRISLDKVVNQLQENGGPSFSDDLDCCRRWSSDVGRYSFGWHLTAGT